MADFAKLRSSLGLGSIAIFTPPQQQDDQLRGLMCVRYSSHSVQSSSLAFLLIGVIAEDPPEGLVKISPQLSLKLKKLVKLHPQLLVRARRYKFEGVSCPFVLLLPCCITSLMGKKLKVKSH